jgi:rhodanese-related sulfurtransferase
MNTFYIRLNYLMFSSVCGGKCLVVVDCGQTRIITSIHWRNGMRNRKLYGLLFTLLAVIFLITSTGECRKSGYNYISVSELKARMDAGDHTSGTLVLVTTQTEKEYAEGHIPAAYPTYARPLKSEADIAKLNPFLEKIKSTKEDVILICPRGHSGAEIPFDYFKKNGIATDRMLILDGGAEAYTKAYPNDVAYGK